MTAALLAFLVAPETAVAARSVRPAVGSEALNKVTGSVLGDGHSGQCRDAKRGISGHSTDLERFDLHICFHQHRLRPPSSSPTADQQSPSLTNNIVPHRTTHSPSSTTTALILRREASCFDCCCGRPFIDDALTAFATLRCATRPERNQSRALPTSCKRPPTSR